MVSKEHGVQEEHQEAGAEFVAAEAKGDEGENADAEEHLEEGEENDVSDDEGVLDKESTDLLANDFASLKPQESGAKPLGESFACRR